MGNACQAAATLLPDQAPHHEAGKLRTFRPSEPSAPPRTEERWSAETTPESSPRHRFRAL